MAIRLMPDRQCSGCTSQEEWGCTAKRIKPDDPDEDPQDSWQNPAYMPITLDDEDTYACPRQHIHENPRYWAQLLKFYSFYKNGYLPQAGAVIDQANQLMEAFRILDQTNADCDAQEREKKNRKKGDPSAR